MELNIPYLLECYNDYKFSSSLTSSMRMDALLDEGPEKAFSTISYAAAKGSWD